MAGEDRRAAREALGMPEERQMPFNLDCEQAVLGSILLHNESYQKVADILTKDSFFEPLHQKIYEVAAELIPAGKTANTLTLQTYLGNPDLGGTTLGQYLARLRTEAAMPMQVREYAGILNDLAVRRQAISIAMDAMDLAYNAPVQMTAKSLVDGMVDKLSSLKTSQSQADDFEDFSSVSERAILSLCDDWKDDTKQRGISTGFPCLDEAIGGLEAPDLILIGGRPGSGKTALATNVAFNVAKQFAEDRANGGKGGYVGFFSLEMSKEQLWQRIISDEAGIPGWRIKKRALSQAEVESIVHAEKRIRRLPMKIDATGRLPIGQLEMRARALKKSRGLDLLVIDYVQLLAGRQFKKREDNRVQELTDITSSLKSLAKELNVPILALAQLSREVDKRDDKRPRLMDLRESGSLEMDSDMVLFIYREEYYLKDAKPREGTEQYFEWERQMAQCKGIAEVNIAKQRHGPPSILTMGFRGDLTRFLNEPEEREMPPETPDRARQRQEKAKSLPKDATILFGVLKALTLSQHATAPTPEQLQSDKKLRPKALIIPADIAREKFGLEAYGPDEDAARVEKAFREGMKALKVADHAYWTGTKETGGFVWVPSLTE